MLRGTVDWTAYRRGCMMSNILRLAQWCAVCALVLGTAACVRRNGATDGSGDQFLGERVKPEQVAPFVPAELPSIQGNQMHELHFAGGAHCGECHPSTQPMPIQQAHEICADCHPSQHVAKPVWACYG